MNKLLVGVIVVASLVMMTSCQSDENPLIDEIHSLEEEKAQLELVGQALDQELLDRNKELDGLREVLDMDKGKLDEKEMALVAAKESFEMTKDQLNVLVAKRNASSQLSQDWYSYHIDSISDKQGAAPLSENVALTLSKLAQGHKRIYDETYGFWVEEEGPIHLATMEEDGEKNAIEWYLPHGEYYATESSFRDYLGKIYTQAAVDQIIGEVMTYNLNEKKPFLSYENRLYTTLKAGTGVSPMIYEQLDKARCLFETYTDTSATVTLIYPSYELERLTETYEEATNIEFIKETYELEKTDRGWRVDSWALGAN